MKIGFDAKRAFHNERGLGNYSRDLLRILLHYYPENQYFLFNPEKSDKQLYQPLNGQQEINPDGIYKIFPSLWRSSGICNKIESLQTGIYHGLSQELPFGIHKKKVKTVVTFHDAIFMRYPELYDRLYRSTFIQKNIYSLQHADCVVAISEQSKQDAMEFFNIPESKIQVIYQGCSEAFRMPCSEENKMQVMEKFGLKQPYILSVGALEPRKNLTTLLKAYSLTETELPLVLVGRETSYAHQLKNKAEELNIKDKVIFLHQVENADMPAIYQSAGLFVFPSVFEGFGIPILEALCSRVPVVTSAGSCFEETGGEASLYVNPHDPEEMAEAMMNVMENKSLHDGMIEAGLQHASEFTDDKIAAKWMNLYTQLI